MKKSRICTIAGGLLLILAAGNTPGVSAIPGSPPELKRSTFRQPAKQAALAPTVTTRIDLGAFARQVQATGRIALPLDAGARVLSLIPNEIRTPDFETYSDQGGKLVPRGRGPCRTYRGWVEGVEGSEVRLYLDDQFLGGLITTPTGVFAIDTVGVDPAGSKRVGSLVKTVVISRAEANSCRTCGTNLVEKLTGGLMAKGAGRAPVGPGGLPGDPVMNQTVAQKTVKIVTDADFEYVQNHGGASATNARLLSFINTYEPFFQQGVGLRLRISGQVVRDTLPQVYTAQSSIGLLGQLEDDWLNRSTPQRSFVMMLTGKTYQPETDSGVSGGSSCTVVDGFVAREGNATLFGPFATLNNLSGLTTLQLDLNGGVAFGDPQCSSNISDIFIGQSPVLGETLATRFCWKTVSGIKQGLETFSGSCIVSSADSTVTVLNSSSRLVPPGGGTVTFSVQGPASNDWQVYTLAPWLSSHVNYATGLVTITVAPLGKAPFPTRTGFVVINGKEFAITQQ